MGYAIVVAWLLARHPDLTDAEVDTYAARMGPEVDRWSLGFPAVAHLERLYAATARGERYTPPGALPSRRLL